MKTGKIDPRLRGDDKGKEAGRAMEERRDAMATGLRDSHGCNGNGAFGMLTLFRFGGTTTARNPCLVVVSRIFGSRADYRPVLL